MRSNAQRFPLSPARAVGLGLILMAAPGRAQEPAGSPEAPRAANDTQAAVAAEEALLDRLLGTWKVSGTIEGEPIDQRLHVQRTLAGRFVELHFQGDAPPAEGMPPYEARIFIGWNAKKRHYVAYWLDVFGAAGSIAGEGTPGAGKLAASSFQLVFKYPSGWFRNSYSFDEKTGAWRLLIEVRNRAGQWSTFADERFTR